VASGGGHGFDSPSSGITTPSQSPVGLEARARRTLGGSSDAIHRLVADALRRRFPAPAETVVDVGCGTGGLFPLLRPLFRRYVGVDAVHYDGFPSEAEFHALDLDAGRVPLPDGCADAVVAVETIEHLENPRAFVRELARLACPGGWVAVTTPNQLSLLSKATLVLRGQFNAFQDASYPEHITALLESDLRRIATECALEEVAVEHTRRGRVPGTGLHWPAALAALFPRALSDNVMLVARKPRG
jgi:2-polyprenyl-3-methyl-5-hydroxy-6-metoxy-1,4-benzoquinol methylase